MKKPDGYVVWDTKEQKMWENPKGKKMWKRRCDAGNAWTCHESKWIPNTGPGEKHWTPKFSEQNRYVTKAAWINITVEE